MTTDARREVLGLFRAKATYTVARDLLRAQLTPDQLTKVGVTLRKARLPDYEPSHDQNKRAAESFDELFNVRDRAAGATIAPRGPLNPKKGYAVGKKSREIEGRLTLKDVTTYLEEHQGPDDYLGLWRSDGTVYLDTTIIVDTKEEALETAIAHRQIAVYDFETGTEISTSDLQAELEPAPPPGARRLAIAAQKARKKP